MPDIDWQTPVAFICVVAAAVYLLLRLRSYVCGTQISGCHDCPQSSTGGSHDGTHVISEDQISVTVHEDDPT